MSIAQYGEQSDATATAMAWSSLLRMPSLGDVAEHTPAEEDYKRRLGAVIVELRGMRRMSQATLAERVGRSEPTVSRWETGKSQPEAFDLHKLAGILEAPAELLLDPPERPVSPVALRLAAMRAIEAAAADGMPSTPAGGADQDEEAEQDQARGRRRTPPRGR